MNVALAFFIVCSVVAFAVAVERTGFHRGRWTIADLLNLTFLACVLIALAKFLFLAA